MIRRSEKGTMQLNHLQFEILIGDMFGMCKNKQEIEWLWGSLIECIDEVAQEREDELED